MIGSLHYYTTKIGKSTKNLCKEKRRRSVACVGLDPSHDGDQPFDQEPGENGQKDDPQENCLDINNL